MIIVLLMALGLFAAVNSSLVESGIAYAIGIVGWLLELILSPVNALIDSTMPALSEGIEAVNAMLALATTYFGWIVNATLLSTAALSLVVSYYMFAFLTTSGVWILKNVLKWRKSLLG